MKINIRQWLLVTAATASLASCFKDEPANAECDIEKAWLHFDNPGACVWSLNDTIQEDSALINRDLIVFRVKPGTDRSQLAPMFALTPGATIRPANGSAHDFTNDTILYTVTSEDGDWQRIYKVAVQEQRRTAMDIIHYRFEHFDLYQVPNSSASYYTWYEMVNATDKEEIWASGNAGFKLSNFSAKPAQSSGSVPRCANGHKLQFPEGDYLVVLHKPDMIPETVRHRMPDLSAQSVQSLQSHLFTLVHIHLQSEVPA